MTLDGRRQRNALTAAENAIRALGGGDVERARRAAAKAIELDQIGIYAGLAAAVGEVSVPGEPITAEQWAAVAAAVGPGPLQALIDEVRVGGG